MNIKISNLKKEYDHVLILNNISIEIKNVGVVGILGESGCGKSTLLRQLSGIEYPDEGEIQINEYNLNPTNIKMYQDNIGVVFQKHNLFPHLTVRENIMLILTTIKKIDKANAEKICNDIITEFSLQDQADKIPSKISGGQAQRASIARAIASKPDIIFLDEPTAALDPLLTKEVLESIQHLKVKGSEFVFVTHEMDFLEKFADYFIFMDKGEIIEHGYITQLIEPKTKKLKIFMNR